MNNHTREIVHSSKSVEWPTPQDLFDRLNAIYHFQLDPCSTDENTKCGNHFTIADNGLMQKWHPFKSVFMNPPYGAREIPKWIQKAYEESCEGCVVVCLIPARTDTRWFHDYCLKYGKVEFIRGRLTFMGSENPAPFPSAIVVFENQKQRTEMK